MRFLGTAFVRHNKYLANASDVLESDFGVRVIPKIGHIFHEAFVLAIWGRSDKQIR